MKESVGDSDFKINIMKFKDLSFSLRMGSLSTEHIHNIIYYKKITILKNTETERIIKTRKFHGHFEDACSSALTLSPHATETILGHIHPHPDATRIHRCKPH